MKRYEVVTYSYDIGIDTQMDYSKFSEAVKAARKFLGLEEYAAIYDRVKKIAYVIFGDITTEVFTDNIPVIEW